MAEFKDAGKFVKVAFILAFHGAVLFLFALDLGLATTVDNEGIEATIVISIIAYVLGMLLMFCLIFLDDVKEKRIVKLLIGILLIAGGALTIIGTAMWGSDLDDKHLDPPTYTTTLGVLAALLYILAGIFAIVDFVKNK